MATEKSLVIAHRGSSGEYPEHTMAGFQKAIDDGADALEVDLFVTADGKLVVFHEPMLSLSTNIATIPEFVTRRRTDSYAYAGENSKEYNDWWVTDFTLNELKHLRRRQKETFRNRDRDDIYPICSYKEILDLIQANNWRIKALVELKNPIFNNKHLKHINSADTFESLVVKETEFYGFKSESSPVFFQTFYEPSGFILLNITKLPVFFFEWKSEPNDSELDVIKESGYVGLGVWKALLHPGYVNSYKYSFKSPSNLISRCHAKGLKVFVWTLRNEDQFLPWNFKQDFTLELKAFYDAKVDG